MRIDIILESKLRPGGWEDSQTELTFQVNYETTIITETWGNIHSNIKGLVQTVTRVNK